MTHFPQGQLIHLRRSEFQTLAVYQAEQLRLLRVDDQAIQSACNLLAPEQLCLPYAQFMMGIFLFQPAPEKVLLLGLGGGDMVRYLHHALPQCQLTAVDIDANTFDIAQRYFELPDDRVDGVCQEAHHFVESNRGRYHTVLIDLYATQGPPALLHDIGFFEHCRQRLTLDGVLALNLITEDADVFADIVCKIRLVFNSLSVCAKVPGHKNIIIFAFNKKPAQTGRADLSENARQLSQRYELNFNAIVEALFDSHPLKDGELILVERE